MKKKLIVLLPLIFMASFMLYSCKVDSDLGGTITVNENINVADATGTVTGRVLDAATRVPIEGATITLIVNGEKKTTTSKATSDEDLKGYFAISGVPAGDHRLTIEAEGYAEYAKDVRVKRTHDNTPVSVSVGWIGLGKILDLTVVVTNDGTAVAGATVAAYAEGHAWLCDGYDVGEAEVFEGVTDASGIATLTGLNMCAYYIILAPAFDADGDGLYDYRSARIFYDGKINSDSTVSLELTKAERHDYIRIIATSLDNNYPASFDMRTITDWPGNSLLDSANSLLSAGYKHTILFVFNYPVSLTGGLTVSWRDLLIDPDAGGNSAYDTGYGVEEEIPVTASLDSTGTILSVAPNAGNWPKVNSVIEVLGTVTATIGGQTQSAEIDDLLGGSMVYIEDDTATGLSSATIVTADNYSGSSKTDVNEVWLQFPEFVYGSYSVVATYDAATSAWTIENDDPVTFESGELVYTDGDTKNATVSGKESGVFYRVNTNRFMNDSDKIRVHYDVTDAVGNRLYGKDKVLTVQ